MGKLPGVIPMEAVGLPEHGAGAARDRIVDERATVVTRPGVRRKSVALADVTAVRRNAPHLCAKPRQQCGNIGIDGDGAHTGWEYALVSSIEPRARLMRRLLETLE